MRKLLSTETIILPRCVKRARRAGIEPVEQTVVLIGVIWGIWPRAWPSYRMGGHLGHREGDLIKVKWPTRLVILAKVKGTDATSVREGFTRKLRHVPTLLWKTLTYDRGKEMAEHEQLAQRLAIQIFFADPYSPLAARHEREYEWPAAPILTCPRARTCRATRNASRTLSPIA